jgi:hypothetical protein
MSPPKIAATRLLNDLIHRIGIGAVYAKTENRMFKRSFPATLALCLVVTGCGSGDSGSIGQGDPPVPAAKFTQANYVANSKEAFSALNTFSKSTESLATGVETESKLDSLHYGITELLKRLGRRGATLPSIASGVVYEDTEACASGGLIKYENHDLNNNDDVDIGELSKIIYQQCRVTVGGTVYTISGTLTATVRDLRYNATTDEYEFIRALVEYQSFSVKSNLMESLSSGNADLQSQTSGARSQFQLIVEEGLSSQVTYAGTAGSTWNYKSGFRFDGTTQSGITTLTYTGNGSNPSVGSGLITFETLAPFTYGSNIFYPTSGSVLLTAAGGGKVKVETNGTSAKISLDENGDGQFEQNQNIPWADIALR